MRAQFSNVPLKKLEDTHPQTHAVLLYHNLNLILTFDLSPSKLCITSRISQGHTMFGLWTLWGHSFLTCVSHTAHVIDIG